MLEVTTLILLLEGVDKDEYFGFGQCLKSSVQSLTIIFFVYYKHTKEESKNIQKFLKEK
jgi:hypothetical protein